MITDVIDKYVQIVENYVMMIDPPKRNRKIPVSEIIKGILMLLQDSLCWRRLRPCFGSYQIYYYYFTRWTQLGVFKRIEEEIKLVYVTKKLNNNYDFRTVYTDTSLVKNRLGLNKKLNNMGKNPCDKGRLGHKVAILCDDLKAPLAMLAFPANVSDQSTV